MAQPPLSRLHDLAAFLTSQAGLNKRLEALARHAAEATQAASCSISLLAEEEGGKPELKLFASTESGAASPCNALSSSGTCHTVAAWVLERGKAVLIPDLRCAPEREFTLAPPSLCMEKGGSLIGVPITVDDCMIGVMTLCNAPDKTAFGKSHVTMAGIAAALIGKAIQVERVQTLLRSRIAQLTLVRQQGAVADRLTAGTLPPTRLAKLLARSFYKDLAAAGFEPGQIIEAATEIIDQITSDIGRFEKRMARKSKEK